MGVFGIFIIAIVLVVISAIFSFVPVGLWIAAIAANVPVSLSNLISMRLRRVPPSIVVDAFIQARKAGLSEITLADIENHYLEGGNVRDFINALIASRGADIDLPLERAISIDLAGRNVLQAVQMSVQPKVIETPPISAVAKNGIELIVKARVTVRANIDRLVGGAGEETIIARVGEGIVTTVGSSESHEEVLENPDLISRTVLEKSLDSGTAFEILSIDIADVDVGKNIGARLSMDQAEAEKNIAQAKAAERRFAAQALEQEMKAKTQEMRAKVVEAEARIPEAIAEALKTGKLGVLDYYNLQNILADTKMRESIAQSDEPSEESK